MAGKPIRWK